MSLAILDALTPRCYPRAMPMPHATPGRTLMPVLMAIRVHAFLLPLLGVVAARLRVGAWVWHGAVGLTVRYGTVGLLRPCMPERSPGRVVPLAQSGGERHGDCGN